MTLLPQLPKIPSAIWQCAIAEGWEKNLVLGLGDRFRLLVF